MNEFIVTPEICRAINRLPTQCDFPGRYGIKTVRITRGDYSAWAWNVHEPAEFIGEGFPVMGQLQPSGVRGATFTGFDLRKGMILNSCNANTIYQNRINHFGIRIRFDSSDNVIDDNDCIRADDAPIHLDAAGKPADVVLFQIKTGKNYNNRFTRNKGAGWTDFWQATYHLVGDDCSGTEIAENDYEIRPQDILPNGTMAEHMENFVDVKVGAMHDPITILSNRVGGFRANARGCYPITIQPGANGVALSENIFYNCSGGIFLKGVTDQNVTSYRDKFIGVGVNYGEPHSWPGKRAVFLGPGRIVSTDPEFILCGPTHEPIAHLDRPLIKPRFVTGVAA